MIILIIFICNFHIYLIIFWIFTFRLTLLFDIINAWVIWKLRSFLRNLLIWVLFFWLIVLLALKITIEHLSLVIILNHLLPKLAESLMSKWIDIKNLLSLLITLLLLILFKLRSLRNCLQFYSVKYTALELWLILRLELNVVIEFTENIWNVLLGFLDWQIYWLHFN